MMEKLARVLAVMITVGSPLAITAIPQTALAQTRGMEHRDDRRDTRQDSRSVKQACKANDNSRAECRQTKRDVKQEGRHNGTNTTPH